MWTEVSLFLSPIFFYVTVSYAKALHDQRLPIRQSVTSGHCTGFSLLGPNLLFAGAAAPASYGSLASCASRRSSLVPTRIIGTPGAWWLISGYHLDLIKMRGVYCRGEYRLPPVIRWGEFPNFQISALRMDPMPWWYWLCPQNPKNHTKSGVFFAISITRAALPSIEHSPKQFRAG